MTDMLMEQATVVRKEWSAVRDSVIYEGPKFIKRTRDKMWFSNLEIMEEILSVYKFTANKYVEDDGSVTLSLNEIDLVENSENEQSARLALGNGIIVKALIMDSPEKIGKRRFPIGIAPKLYAKYMKIATSLKNFLF